ncbi:hypothetical protein BLOT_002676 [Blomia tropicalis]|nr:hypothetical protein BLOT_002676 [Blomia tropicalis]
MEQCDHQTNGIYYGNNVAIKSPETVNNNKSPYSITGDPYYSIDNGSSSYELCGSVVVSNGSSSTVNTNSNSNVSNNKDQVVPERVQPNETDQPNTGQCPSSSNTKQKIKAENNKANETNIE